MRASPVTWVRACLGCSSCRRTQRKQLTRASAATSHSCRPKGWWGHRAPLTAWGSLGKAELRSTFCLPLLPSTSFWLMCGRGEAFSSFCKGRFFEIFLAVFWNGKTSCLIMLNSNSKDIYLVTSIRLACPLHDLVQTLKVTNIKFKHFLSLMNNKK